MTQNADMRRESGTCNVCSAPCSSCMHFNRACTGSKAEYSDENCRLGGTYQYSMDEGDVSSLRSRPCETVVSEASNMISVNSSHDSLSENADSKQISSNKSLEALDDNTSCMSRASNHTLVNGSHPKNADRTNTSCSSASVRLLRAEESGSAPSFDMPGLPEIPSSKEADAGNSSPKTQSQYAQPESGKSHSSIPSSMDMERVANSHIPEKSECFTQNIDSSLKKEIEPSVTPCEKSSVDKDSLIDSSAKVSLKIYPKSEADTIIEVQGAPDEAGKLSVQDEQDKAEQVVESPGVEEEPQSEHESDESDVVEHDVKVCDICGDAGREDLLAICSRCSDGAEHTYCMREMLQKVPEGDWLCEECKYPEETENQRLDAEERKIFKVNSTSQHSGKRLSENIELAPVAKRQAIESSTGSPKSSSPKRIVSLSRESSLKSLDKVKVKPDIQMASRNHSGGDNMDAVRSPTGSRGLLRNGMLLKSNSFNTLNSKPRVKPVDEVVPQKLKGPGENSSKNMETPSRIMGKSMSFKSTNLGRSSTAASKVKLLSSKSIPAQDLKGTRHAKEWGALDRKSLSRVDRSVACSTTAASVVSTPRGDQKNTGLCETSKPSLVSSNRDLKVNQDGKFSKSMSSVGRKAVESQVNSGRTYTSVDETAQDVQPRLRETTNQVEKTRDSPGDLVRADAIVTSKGLSCQNCKEFGHTAECCTIGKTQESVTEVSASATSRSTEEMHKSNNVKAALQAALLRMPEIYKKKEVMNQIDELSPSGTDLKFEVASQDQLPVSSTPKNSISAEETQEGRDILENSTTRNSNDEKQHNLCQTNSCSQTVNTDSIRPSSGKPSVRDLQNQSLTISRVLLKMPIPEYEYIWQGIFELHRSGKPPDLCPGIQAHLSTCASPKVLEVVNKLPSKVPLNEVPRLSTWPSQFHQVGAKENNIALYFFARDIESHERHYRGLLDHMMKNDLALKGIFDGVELLIFPSNQLPEKSQRWNMLFFLWGVFRGRRVNHSDSAKKICIPSMDVVPIKKEFPTAIMTVSETHCSPTRMDEESFAFDRTCNIVSPSNSLNQGHVTVSRNFEVKETHLDQTHLVPRVNLEEQDNIFHTNPTSRIPSSSAQFCEEMKPAGSSLKDSLQECGPDRDTKPSPGAVGTSVVNRAVETKVDPDISLKQEKSLSSGIPSLDSQVGAASTTSEDKFSERMASASEKQMDHKKQKDDQCIDVEKAFRGDLNVEAVNCQQPNDNKFQHIDLSDKVIQTSAVTSKKHLWSEADVKLEGGDCQQPNDNRFQHMDLSDKVIQTSAVTSKKHLWSEADVKLEDVGNSSKKLKTDLSGVYGCSSSGGGDSFKNSFVSRLNDLGSGSSAKDKGHEEACDEKIIPEDLGTMERTFFPVDIHNKKDIHLGPNSLSLKGPQEYGDRFLDEVPNLELALGGEMKSPQKGMLPFFVGEVDKKQNQEKPPDCLADEQEDDGVAASLSLSLSFPSSNKERMKTVSKAEQLLPDGRHVNTSLLLFGRFADK